MSAPRRTHISLRLPVPSGAAGPLRALGLIAMAVLVGLLWLSPELGLALTWGLLVPLLPLWWLLAPGLWRRVCPMAAVNWLPAALGLDSRAPLPARLRSAATVTALAAFVAAVAARKAGLDDSATATATLLAALMTLALAGGVAWGGKSGWCGTLCPLGPIQAVYARVPVVAVESACRPCVGCTTGCPDLAPRRAHRIPAGADPAGHRLRRLVAGALPGVVFGAHATPDTLAALPAAGVAVLVSLGAYFVLEGLLGADRAVTLAAAVALNLFYFFNAVVLVETVAALTGLPDGTVAVWLVRENVAVITLLWLRVALRRPPSEDAAASEPAVERTVLRGIPVTRRVNGTAAPAPAPATVEVTVAPGNLRITVAAGSTLSEALSAQDLMPSGGCGQGLCGNDPVYVLAGEERLSPASEGEQRTLRRHGFASGARMACSTRVLGDVVIALEAPETAAAAAVLSEAAVQAAQRPRRLVVLGGGVAGVVAAERLRAADPAAAVELVAGEPGALYDRMAITELFEDPAGAARLDLRSAEWSLERRIAVHRDAARALDLQARAVQLDSGRLLTYDALVIATGARSRALTIPGAGLDGVHTLRTRAHAMAIGERLAGSRSGTSSSLRAVVLGGGPLGVEAAVALRACGAAVTIVEPAPRLLATHLDRDGADALALSLAGRGIAVALERNAVALRGATAVEAVLTDDGREIPADLVVCCAGVVADCDLARAAGLRVGSGIVVDDHMRTSDRHVYAAGDVAEHAGRTGRLWAAAERQASVAAVNAAGGDELYVAELELLRLKVPGIDVVSIGRRGDDPPIVFSDPARGVHRRLDVSAGRAVGAVLVGTSPWEAAAHRAVERGMELDTLRDELARGDWSALRERTGVRAAIA